MAICSPTRLDASFALPRHNIFGKWIRSLGVTDRKLAPLHSFRHRFKSVAREAGIAREYHEAITGHRAGRTRGDDYGEVPIKALYREILKLPRINLVAER